MVHNVSKLSGYLSQGTDATTDAGQSCLQELLGDLQTQRALRAGVRRLVGLQQYDGMSLAQVLPGIRTSSLPFQGTGTSPHGEECLQASIFLFLMMPATVV